MPSDYVDKVTGFFIFMFWQHYDPTDNKMGNRKWEFCRGMHLMDGNLPFSPLPSKQECHTSSNPSNKNMRKVSTFASFTVIVGVPPHAR